MDYEKAYEDAIERAKGIYNENPSSSTAKFVCGQIFPELHESEDERIINHIIEILNRLAPCHWDGNEKARCIAYLEKLKEFQFGYPGIYFYDGEKLHFQGNPAMEEKQKEPNPSTPIEQEQPHFADASKMEQPECGCSEKPNNLSSEWTEEDERTRWNLCSLLTNLRVGKKIEESTFKKYYSWLKIIHIKPRKTRKSEQPEVDFNEEVERFAKECGYPSAATIDFQFARHFYELGLNARNE